MRRWKDSRRSCNLNKRNCPPLQDTILGFLNLLELGPIGGVSTLNELNVYLDELSLIYNFTNDIEVNTYKPPERLGYKEMRNLVTKHFPDLGLYNIPEKITQDLGETKVVIGDAIDDITDIACDLSEVKWCLNNTDINDALWHFRFGYEHHWGNHLRQLQLYLYSLLYER
jgi:hypothetical protein